VTEGCSAQFAPITEMDGNASEREGHPKAFTKTVAMSEELGECWRDQTAHQSYQLMP